MMPAHLVTLTIGAGTTRPKGREETCPAHKLAQHLNELPLVNGGWWSLSRFEDGYSDNKHWRSAAGVVVDIDTVAESGAGEEGRPLARFTADDLRRVGDIPGNLFHMSPRGARLVFLLAEPVDTVAAWQGVAAGAKAATDEWLARACPQLGQALDVDKATLNRSQRWLRPRALVDGVLRDQVTHETGRADPYPADELAARGGVQPAQGRLPVKAAPRGLRFTTGGPDDFERARAYIAKMPPAVAGQRGHDRTFDVACRAAVDFALGEADVLRLLDEFNARCVPPWSERELAHKAREALKRAASSPDLGRALRPEPAAVGARRNAAPPESAGHKGHKGPEGGVMSLMSRSFGVNENATEAPAWPAIVPVGRQPDLPAYPVDTLPEPLRRWATEVARSLSCPVDLPAILALGAASACVAARYAVRAKADWVEPLNLYLLLGLSSGESKSAAFGPALRPLRAWEREQYKAGLELFEESKSKRRELERRLKQAEKEAAQGGHQEERERAARELARHRVIEPQRLVTEDATPEALGVLMSQQHGRMALFSDEAAPLEVLAGRYSEGRAVVELFNKAYSGTPYICDRVLRETLRVEAPTLTTVLTVQPSCVEALADTPDFEGKGTLGRFLFSLPRSFVGRRVFDVAPVFEGVQDSYAAALRGLLALPADLDDDDDSFKPRLVSLSQAARDEVTAFRTRLEPRLGEGEGDLAHMASWGNKAHGQVVRVAGVLHLLDMTAQGVDPRGVAVPVETVRRALRVVEGYFLPHAMAAWGLMSTSPRHRRLRLLARWIENLPEGQRESVTQREAHRRLDDRQGIDADEVRSLLAELVERGYLMAGPRMDGSRGRPHGATLLVNPALYAKAARVPGMEG